MKDATNSHTVDFLITAKKDKTAAARMAKMRAKKAREFPLQLQAAYNMGFNDAAAGNAPASCETWTDKNAALAYICGGMDAALRP